MHRQKAKSGYHILDGKMIRTDSKMEAAIISQLIVKGFHKKIRRTRLGIGYGFSRYTPDAELCVLHDSMNRRALVEFKPFSTSEFTMDRRRAMVAASRFYNDAICMLYVKKIDKWYMVELNGELIPTAQPTPGGVYIDELPKPRWTVLVFTRYGRGYSTRPSTLLLKKIADGLGLVVKPLVHSRHGRQKGDDSTGIDR